MGLDLIRCINNYIDDQFLCAICCGIIVNPNLLVKCEHIFCQKCIIQWISAKHYCPIDKSFADILCIGKVGESYLRKYSQILLKCENSSLGCDDIIRIIDNFNHSQKCKFNRKHFRQCDCGDYVNIKDDSHNCVEYLKTQIETLKTQQLRLQLHNNELQLKLNQKSEECLQLKRYVSPLKRPESTVELRDLVEALKELRIIRSVRVEQTVLSVDRELFCPQNPYNNHKTDIGFGAEFNSPIIDSMLLELLQNHLVEGARVLDIGCGTGYLSVCMAYMCAKGFTVKAIDHIPELIESAKSNVKMNFANTVCEDRIEFIEQDGRCGYPESGPYDVINVGVSVQKYPQFLVTQLKEGGRMTVPIGEDNGVQNLETIDKLSNGSTVRKVQLKVSLKSLISKDMQLKY